VEEKLHGFVPVMINERQAIADEVAYDMDNHNVGKALSLRIASVKYKRKPECVALDGLSVMDDVGGIHGYVDFLKTIHGDDPAEKEDMKSWARFMGWTGRMNRPETLL